MTLAGYLKRIRKGQERVNRLALFILASLTFVGAVSASLPHAEAAAGDHGAGLGLGQAMLMGDWAEDVDDTLAFTLKYSYEASALFGLMADIYYASHSNNVGTNSLSVKGLTPNLRVNFAYIDKLVLYGFTGFGLFLVDKTEGTASGSVMTLGYNLGAAANLALNEHFQFGTELSFHNIFGKTTAADTVANTPSISIGGTYLLVSLNVMYIF